MNEYSALRTIASGNWPAGNAVGTHGALHAEAAAVLAEVERLRADKQLWVLGLQNEQRLAALLRRRVELLRAELKAACAERQDDDS